MPRKKKVAPTYPPGWEVSDHLVWHGRHIEPGVELSFTGQRGRFRFVKYVKSGDAEWVDVIGKDRWRSFRPKDIKTVHRLKKLRPTG